MDTLNTVTENNNYFYVIPDSHFWNSIEQILLDLKLNPEFNLSYLKIGLENTIKNKYVLKKENKMEITASEARRISQEEFDKCSSLDFLIKSALSCINYAVKRGSLAPHYLK